MRYVQPYGITDVDAAYINGDPSIGRQGSIPPAAAFEHPMREIVHVIEKSLIVPAESDLSQMAKAVRSQALNYAVDTGTVNQLLVAYDPPLVGYTVGLPLRVKLANTNTGAAVTINAGAGAVSVKKMNGANPVVGELVAGAVLELVFDGTAFQLINFGGAGGGTGGGDIINNFTSVNMPYVGDTGTVNHIVANFSPAITTLAAGFVCLVKLANTFTGGPVDIVVNALAAKAVKVTDGTDPVPADCIAGDVIFLKYDGNHFIVDPFISILVDCTFNVPSTQFPTTASVFNALKRKTIAPTATVTIQLAAGVFPPIVINHPNADRIAIKGTMIGAAPTYADFARSGPSAAQRSTDGALNLTMLRSRYGTEIRFSDADKNAVYTDYAYGIINVGPGGPLLQDLLVTGDNIKHDGAYNHGIATRGTKLKLANCAAWGAGFGIIAYGGGAIEITSPCFACSNTWAGFVAWVGSMLKAHFPIISLGNGVNGCSASTSSAVIINWNCPGSRFECNGNAGTYDGDFGVGVYFMAVYANNGLVDVEGWDNCLTLITGASYSSTFPYVLSGGNNGAWIDHQHLVNGGPF